jgi:hypothetical protein
MDARDVIDLWPSTDELAKDLGLEKPDTARKWRSRNWIPPIHWPDLLDHAKRRRIKLTLQDLRAMKREAA